MTNGSGSLSRLQDGDEILYRTANAQRTTETDLG